jgi:hypothetical protein
MDLPTPRPPRTTSPASTAFKKEETRVLYTVILYDNYGDKLYCEYNFLTKSKAKYFFQLLNKYNPEKGVRLVINGRVRGDCHDILEATENEKIVLLDNPDDEIVSFKFMIIDDHDMKEKEVGTYKLPEGSALLVDRLMLTSNDCEYTTYVEIE